MCFYVHFPHVITYGSFTDIYSAFVQFFCDFWGSIYLMTALICLFYILFQFFFSYRLLRRLSTFPAPITAPWCSYKLCNCTCRYMMIFNNFFTIFRYCLIKSTYWLFRMFIAFFNISTASLRFLFSFFSLASSFASSLE